jgi:membrane protein YdbS with pleckstrin-like domain
MLIGGTLDGEGAGIVRDEMNPGHEQQQPHPQPHPGFAPPAQAQAQSAQAQPPGQSQPAQPGQAQPAAPQPAPPQGYPADQAFAAGNGYDWGHISKRFTWHRRISVLLTAVPVGLIGALVVFRGGGTVAMVLWGAAVLLAVVLAWIVAELAFRAYGYAERGDDLLVTQGVFVKRLIVVPYGRMQFVDVTAGLLERWMGIATVRMHTAAAATDAQIPGLPAAEAALLRDRLAQKGEERSMGL